MGQQNQQCIQFNTCVSHTLPLKVCCHHNPRLRNLSKRRNSRRQGSKCGFTAVAQLEKKKSQLYSSSSSSSNKSSMQKKHPYAAFHPAAPIESKPSANRFVLRRPFDSALSLGGQHGRAGLGHSAPSLMDVDPQH